MSPEERRECRCLCNKNTTNHHSGRLGVIDRPRSGRSYEGGAIGYLVPASDQLGAGISEEAANVSASERYTCRIHLPVSGTYR